ncbi:radical SAM protein [Sporanaerobacter acetigenes]|uniref:Radical SAM superfamily protein n=1 Tax=Sporanaerobacter acetigenes DSM 13106 TaxID=1123281 RepID=A0A1M5YQS3_9FIRM|nr:radical SAM protein [Sporanaerobacter acetigenes]SHI13923.1 Radical SAM superfamily protein [Sporanaerobacter acetigenes DSM 13106]
MRYEGTLYRPPSEAYSLIVQATIGCSQNRCTFCSMYKEKDFRIRKTRDIVEDLILGRQEYRKVEKIFLADGDALIIKTEELLKILEKIKTIFPECKRVGIYASPKSILGKSTGELIELRKSGLGIVYMGVESGSDLILEKIKKGVNSSEMIAAGKKIKEAEIPLSITLISGLGGKEYSMEHGVESARVVNEMNPDYIGLLTLLVEEGTELYDDVWNERFKLLTPKEVLLETREFVQRLNLDNCIFRSNHASNYVALGGTLNKDKNLILEQIKEGLKMEGLEEGEIFRRL